MQLFIFNILYNIATILLFNIIEREAKELLCFSVFIITRYCKGLKYGSKKCIF